MTEGEGITLAALAKKIDSQERFNRTLMIVSCISVIGLLAYCVADTFTNLPSTVLLHYMANMESIVTEWNIIQHQKGRDGAK